MFIDGNKECIKVIEIDDTVEFVVYDANLSAMAGTNVKEIARILVSEFDLGLLTSILKNIEETRAEKLADRIMCIGELPSGAAFVMTGEVCVKLHTLAEDINKDLSAYRPSSPLNK